MLDYLRDPNKELPAEQESNNASQQKDKDYLTVATKGKDVRRSTTILGVLFIIGLICLGVMIKKSAPKSASAQQTVITEELEIEKAITQVTGIREEFFNKMDEIVDKFYEFSDVVQVQVNELVKNPFQLESFLNKIKEDPENEDSNINVEMIVKQQIKMKAKELKLYSTMVSEKGVCCMINNKILSEGESIEDFIVKKISNEGVTLEMEGVEIDLKMSK